MKKKTYKQELKTIQADMVQLQRHVRDKGLKVVILLEGRDSAGKGGVIKRMVQRLNPNYVRVVAKGKPTDAEEKQWYFQRWAREMPQEGEIVIFDRSWYSRAGVESVMEFATKRQVTSFLKDAPSFEKTLSRQGVIVIKYWLSITHKTQENRFHERLNDITKQWKLSKMDLESRTRWDEYTKAKERMFRKTSHKICPWNVVDANCKRQTRLTLMKHLVSQFTFERKEHEPKRLPHVFINNTHNKEFDALRIL